MSADELESLRLAQLIQAQEDEDASAMLDASVDTVVPSSTHYLGYVEDFETPDMIMRKFQELDNVQEKYRREKVRGVVCFLMLCVLFNLCPIPPSHLLCFAGV